MEMFVGFFRYPLSNKRFNKEKENIYQWIKLRNQYLLKKLKESTVEISYKKFKNNKIRLLVSIDGYSSVQFDVSEFKNQNIKAFYNLDETAQTIQIEKLELYPGLKKDNNYYYEQTKDSRMPKYYLFPDSQYYLFELDTIDLKDFKNKLKNSFKNLLTEKKLIPNIVDNNKSTLKNIKYNDISIHPWKIKKPNKVKSIILGPGVKFINKNIISDPGQNIEILPNTKLLLGKNVSIISQGKLILKGEKNNKVVIEKLNSNYPWGIIAAVGKYSEGSTLENCEISGGSKANLLNINFSGMVSFNWSNKLNISNCKFSNNFSGDDTVRVINSSNVQLNNINFNNCFGDCLDFDYVEGLIKNTTVENSGNDGLDFMGSKTILENIKINSFSDKGISIGEKSNLLMSNLIIKNGNVGIAIKDDSLSELNRSEIYNNNIGLDIFKKNWRFSEPGYISVKDSKIIQNGIDLRTVKSNFYESKSSVIKEILID